MRTLVARAQPTLKGSRWKAALARGSLAVFASLLGAGASTALDQPTEGKKLRLKSTPKLVLLSKDPGIDVGGSDPRCPSGGSALVLDDGVNTATFLLPCANWRVNGSGTFKYRNSSAPNGASAVEVVRIKNGHLKVIGRGLGGIPVPSGAGTIDVVLHLDGASHRFCMSFTGTGDGNRFVVRDAPAASCPVPPPCDATTGGFCWFLGTHDASCDVACAIQGRAYDSATETHVGSGGSDANCVAVLDALGVPAGPLTTSTGCFDGVGCFYAPPLGRVRCAFPPTNSTSSSSQRACACQ
jgi:hypothetical protein